MKPVRVSSVVAAAVAAGNQPQVKQLNTGPGNRAGFFLLQASSGQPKDRLVGDHSGNPAEIA